MKKVFTLLAVMILSVSFSLAGDLSFKIVIFPEELHHGSQEDIVVEYENLNTQFSVNLDGSKYPSGTYYCRLISESGIRTIKLVKE